jgi:hypothetical protein
MLNETKIREALKNIVSRGLKQRLKNKINKKINNKN